MSYSTSSKIKLVIISTVVTLILVVAVYEIRGQIQYTQWRSEFVDSFWNNKINTKSKNDTLIWEYKPNFTSGLITTNRFGFRDIDYEKKARPPGTYRIAFAGDSVTVGTGVLLSQTFVRVFNNAIQLKYPKRKVEAMNFAVDGYQAEQIGEMIRTRVVEFQPSKIIYIMCLNDFDFVDSSGLKIRYFKRPTSFLWEKLFKVWEKADGRDFHMFFFDRFKDEVFEAIRGMKASADKAGSRFEVVILPVFPGKEVAGERFETYSLTGIHQEIMTFLKENHIRGIDLLPAFLATKRPARQFSQDLWHLNPAGHQFVAQQLLKRIKLD